MRLSATERAMRRSRAATTSPIPPTPMTSPSSYPVGGKIAGANDRPGDVCSTVGADSSEDGIHLSYGRNAAAARATRDSLRRFLLDREAGARTCRRQWLVGD